MVRLGWLTWLVISDLTITAIYCEVVSDFPRRHHPRRRIILTLRVTIILRQYQLSLKLINRQVHLHRHNISHYFLRRCEPKLDFRPSLTDPTVRNTLQLARYTSALKLAANACEYHVVCSGLAEHIIDRCDETLHVNFCFIAL